MRQQRGVGWDEERFAGPDQQPARGQVPDPEVAGQREQSENDQDSGADQVGGQHDEPLGQPVGCDPADQHEREQADAEQGGNQRKLRGAAAQFDHLPRQRDQPQPASDQRDSQSRPQQAEVAVTQGTKGRGYPAQHGYDPTGPNHVAHTILIPSTLLYPTLYTRPFRLFLRS